MATYGTAHFVSRAAAIAYYREYGYDDVAHAVDAKIAEGEIFIGRPRVFAGQTVSLIDNGRRYAISDSAA